MINQMRRRIKRRLSRQWMGRGGIFDLLRLFLFKRWFRRVCLLGLAGMTALALFLAPVWKTTPEGFAPVVHLSGLSKVQALALARTARRVAAQGNWPQERAAWLAAEAHDPGKAGLFRGFLRGVMAQPAGKEPVQRLFAQGRWLLRLTSTNRADALLMAKIWEHEGFPEAVIAWLRPLHTTGDRALEGVYLRNLFWLGDYARFQRGWVPYARRGPLTSQERLFNAAYCAGWGQGSVRKIGWEVLDRACQSPSTAEEAERLVLRIAAHRGDRRRCRSALEWLHRRGKAGARAEGFFLRLLLQEGWREAARVELLHAASRMATWSELRRLLPFYRELNLEAAAANLLAKRERSFGTELEFWAERAVILLRLGRWEEVERAALKLRVRKRNGGAEVAYSYYLEGWALREEHLAWTAHETFQKILRQRTPSPGIGLTIAKGLIDLREESLAEKLLAKLKPSAGRFRSYWVSVFGAAYRTGNLRGLLAASARLFASSPENWQSRWLRAVALIRAGRQPGLAVRLTFDLCERFPHSSAARLNHAEALLLNCRWEEALTVLERVDPEHLDRRGRAILYWACFRAHTVLGHSQLARACARKIERAQLFPEQARQLERSLARGGWLPPESTEKIRSAKRIDGKF